MQYVNHVYDEKEQAVLYSGPVEEGDVAYLRRVIAHLRPLSDEEYMDGPAVILNTPARFSYVLEDRTLYWCIEWDPGLIVIRISPNGEMAWVALRSPVPDFGSREPIEKDLRGYDEDAENPQYNLVFTSWDAQFDEQEREWYSFIPADANVQSRFDNALAHVNALHAQLNERLTENSSEWVERCKQNLERWCGEGTRVSVE